MSQFTADYDPNEFKSWTIPYTNYKSFLYTTYCPNNVNEGIPFINIVKVSNILKNAEWLFDQEKFKIVEGMEYACILQIDEVQ